MNWSPAHIAVPIDILWQISYSVLFHKKPLSLLSCPLDVKKHFKYIQKPDLPRPKVSGCHFTKQILMNIFEKIYSVLAIIFTAGFIASLIYFPQLRQLNHLLPLSLLGLVINIGLMFTVLQDIYKRQFNSQRKKYFWIALILLFWPAILYYLPRYGFHPRLGQ